MSRRYKTLADELNAARPAYTTWLVMNAFPVTQSYRCIGNVTQNVVRIGLCWAWLIVDYRTGQILAGEIDWNMSAIEAAEKADAALEVAGGVRT